MSDNQPTGTIVWKDLTVENAEVEDIDSSIRRAVELGGHLIDGPRKMGKNRFCVIRDPAGAVMALISE